MKTRDLTLAALMTCFIAACSLISIPSPLVPFTLQVFAIVFASSILTRKQLLLAVLTYILLGIIGLPIFAGGKGGPQSLLSPSFGFIIGFIPLSLTQYTLIQNKKVTNILIRFIIGSFVLYLIGLTVLSVNLRFVLGINKGIKEIFVGYCLMFMPTDFLSYYIAHIASDKIKKINGII